MKMKREYVYLDQSVENLVKDRGELLDKAVEAGRKKSGNERRVNKSYKKNLERMLKAAAQ